MEPDLDQITTSLEELFARVAAAREAAPSPELRQQLGALQAFLGEGKAKFADEYRRLVAGLNQRIAGVRQSTKETLQAVEDARAKVAATKAAAEAPKPAAPPKPPEPPIDPNLGQQLRAELLQRFGLFPPESSRSPEPDREIWEDWGSDG